uniref:ARAD1C45760p n=1 Tax=Blastobotrys adeninivorans TaxID=409370 RepID=A0A060T4Z4_BLAAD
MARITWRKSLLAALAVYVVFQTLAFVRYGSQSPKSLYKHYFEEDIFKPHDTTVPFEPPLEGPEDFDFSMTANESWCYTPTRYSSDPIPNVVHFIELRSKVTFVTYLAIKAALTSMKPDQIKLHHSMPLEEDMWLLKVRPHITLVSHNLTQEFPLQVEQGWDEAHMADAMRLRVMYEEGGIYMDTDTIALRSFERLRHNPRGLILGSEGPSRNGLANGVILARKHSNFIRKWIDSYVDFVVGEWNDHSVIKPKELSEQYPEEICKLAPSVYYWPMYPKEHIDYMHEELSDDQAKEFIERVERYGGSMLPNQLAYHCWNRGAARYLTHLTPRTIKTKNTRFNILVRRFLD